MATGRQISKFDAFVERKYIPLEKKIKILLAAIILLLPVALCVFFLFKPTNDKINLLKQEKNKVAKQVEQAKKTAATIEQHRAEMEKAKALFEKAAVLLPKKKEIPNLLRNISDHGKGAGLDFISFKPGSEIPKDFYAEIPVDISIRGPYHNMGYFLDQVSKLQRIVTVNNIKMGGPKKEGSEMLLDSTCRLLTYRFTNVALPKPDEKKK